MTARFNGRSPRWFVISRFDHAGFAPSCGGTRALAALVARPDAAHVTTARYARIRDEDAEVFAGEMPDVVNRFLTTERSGTSVDAIVGGILATDRPFLPGDQTDAT